MLEKLEYKNLINNFVIKKKRWENELIILKINYNILFNFFLVKKKKKSKGEGEVGQPHDMRDKGRHRYKKIS